MDTEREDQAIAATRRWIDAAVIGLNLCPFARGVVTADRVRYRVSRAQGAEALRVDLLEELRFLASATAAEVETTLLIHPWALADFLEFNDFLAVAGAAVEELRLA